MSTESNEAEMVVRQALVGATTTTTTTATAVDEKKPTEAIIKANALEANAKLKQMLKLQQGNATTNHTQRAETFDDKKNAQSGSSGKRNLSVCRWQTFARLNFVHICRALSLVSS